MKYFFYAVLLIVLQSLTVGLLGYLTFFDAVPNLFFLAAVVVALDLQNDDHLWFAVAAGLFLDLSSQTPVGTYLFSFLCIVSFLRFLIANFVNLASNWKYLLGMVSLSWLFCVAFVWFYSNTLSRWTGMFMAVNFHDIKRTFVPQLAYNLALLYPIYALMAAVKRMVAAVSPRKI